MQPPPNKGHLSLELTLLAFRRLDCKSLTPKGKQLIMSSESCYLSFLIMLVHQTNLFCVDNQLKLICFNSCQIGISVCGFLARLILSFLLIPHLVVTLKPALVLLSMDFFAYLFQAAWLSEKSDPDREDIPFRIQRFENWNGNNPRKEIKQGKIVSVGQQTFEGIWEFVVTKFKTYYLQLKHLTTQSSKMADKKLCQLLFTAIIFSLMLYTTDAGKSKTEKCLATGLDVLRETRDIKRFRATFDLETVSLSSLVKFLSSCLLERIFITWSINI